MQWKFTYYFSGEIIGTRAFIHWREYLWAIWLVSTTNAQQKSLEWDVMEKHKEASPFFHLQVHDLTNRFTSFFLHSRIVHTHTHTHSHSFSLQCVPQGRAASCWKMLLPAHLCVCTRIHTCISLSVYGCVRVYVCARENTFSCFSSNGPAETCVSHSKVPGCCLIDTSQQYFLNNWGVRVGCLT